MAKVAYLMESEREAERLLVKGDRKSTHEQLLLTGFSKLPTGAHIVDAGSGAGFVSEIMADTATQSNNPIHLTLLDGSRPRLDVAQSKIKFYESITAEYINCDLAKIPLKDSCVDYVFCRFVFEYLESPETVFQELLRITKPGGRLVIGDLDYNCLSHYPLAPDLEEQLKWMMNHLQSKKLLDPYAGRKIYSYFYKYKLTAVKPHLIAHHLFCGKLSEEDRFNWEAKLLQIEELTEKKVISAPFNVHEFKTRFMQFLESPDRFTYTPLILVEGVKP